MLTMSPSRSTRGPGIPCTTSSLTEIQVTAGKGTLPGTPLNSGMAWCSSKKCSTAASISAVVTPGFTSEAATCVPSRRASPPCASGRFRATTAEYARSWFSSLKSVGGGGATLKTAGQGTRGPLRLYAILHSICRACRRLPERAGKLRRIALAVDRAKQALTAVIIAQRGRSLVVVLEPLADHLGRVVGAAAGRQPPDQFFLVGGDLEDHVERRCRSRRTCPGPRPGRACGEIRRAGIRRRSRAARADW